MIGYLQRIPVKAACKGYYLRWYYTGFHYWFWLPGSVTSKTEGEVYRTLGTRLINMSSGQITRSQVEAIRTILYTREIDILTDTSWKSLRVVDSTVIIYDNQVDGAEIEITVVVGSRILSVTGFTPVPVVNPPLPVYTPTRMICIGTQMWDGNYYNSKFPGSRVYNDNEANRAIYGGLYSYAQISASGFAPVGWHVPTLAELQTLITYCGGASVAGGILKEVGTSHWVTPNTGAVDSVGFTALPCGYYDPNTGYNSLGLYGWLASITSLTSVTFETALLYYDAANVVIGSANKLQFTPVRLLRDLPCVTPNLNGALYNWYALNKTITYTDWFLPSKDELNAIYTNLYLQDIGGLLAGEYWSSSEYDIEHAWLQNFSTGVASSFYLKDRYLYMNVIACRTFISAEVFAIGSQSVPGCYIFYIVDNLNGTFTYYEVSPEVQNNIRWWNLGATLVGISAQGTDIGTGTTNTDAIIAHGGVTSGAVYFAETLAPVISLFPIPAGWHIPTAMEFLNFIYGSVAASGNSLKQVGLTNWNDNLGSDLWGFNALGSGIRNGNSGNYEELKESFFMWQKEESDANNGNFLQLYSSLDTIMSLFDGGYSPLLKSYGMSVRLIKDDSTDPGTMADIDGNVYPTIKIDTQVWMASNLKVEHFNNGAPIPMGGADPTFFTDAEWAALTTAGMCWYNNTP